MQLALEGSLRGSARLESSATDGLDRSSHSHIASASVIIVDYKSAAAVSEFLFHMSNSGLEALEFVVFRNSCLPDDPPLEVPPGLRTIELRSEKNLGFGAAFNLAVEQTTSAVILSCNADTKPTRQVVDAMLDRVCKNPRRIAAPVLFNEHGEESGRPFYSLGRMVGARIPAIRKKALNGTPDWIVGACFAISRDFFTDLGGFHRAYKLYLEDVDLCWRAWELGEGVEVLTSERVYHRHGRASSKVLSRPFAYHVRSGIMYFVLHPRAIVGSNPSRA
ncbi:glycosyltransferase family 2 protein [Actinomycetospora chiangmaiensis]|uniref:glycosyltransferase family 2 protein n=1 Tax=Actinomycetospora chiangmaiensis TaxID=402650 RepID=UPI0012FAE367|nr:glycosyltransferase [Actinomycetospora chiangmaiensis]